MAVRSGAEGCEYDGTRGATYNQPQVRLSRATS